MDAGSTLNSHIGIKSQLTSGLTHQCQSPWLYSLFSLMGPLQVKRSYEYDWQGRGFFFVDQGL